MKSLSLKASCLCGGIKFKTEAEQKVLRNSMQRDADTRKKDMDLALENFKNSLQQQENKA